MYCISYEKLTDFIADKCTFISPDIKYLSIHTPDGKWRRYFIENKIVTRAQFFVENIPNFNCYIEDIVNVKGTNRMTIKLIKPKVVERVLDDISTVDDLYHLVTPQCIHIKVDNGTTVSYPIKDHDKSEIKYVEIGKNMVTLYTKF